MDSLSSAQQKVFQSLLDASSDWLYWLTPNAEISYISPACQTISGYTPAEFMADASLFDTLIHPDDHPKYQLKQCLDVPRDAPHHIEFRIITKAGQLKCIEHNCQAVYDHNGTYLGRQASNQDITDKCTLEQTLYDLNRQLQEERSLFLNGPVVVFRWQQQGTRFVMRYISPNVEKIMGYRPEELLAGKIRSSSIIFEADRELVNRTVQQHVQRKADRLAHMPYRMVRKDGQLIWVSDFALLIYDDTGNPYEMIGYFVDITAQVKATELLQESQERLTMVLESANLGYWDWYIAQDGLMVNTRWAQIVGYRLDEINPSMKSLLASIHPDDATWVGDMLTAHLNGENDHYVVEYRIRHRQGSWIWVLDAGKVVAWDDEGQPLRAVGIRQDINERKDAEYILKRSQDGLAQAQRLARLGNWNWNILTDEVFWSDEIYRIFDVTVYNFANTYAEFADYIHPDDRLRFADALQSSLAESSPLDIVHRILLPHGVEKVVHERGKTIYNIDGEPLRMIGTIQDVTQLHQTQTELKRQRNIAQSLQQMALILNKKLELTAALTEILKQLVQFINFESVAIFLPQHDDLVLVNGLGFAKAYLGRGVALSDKLNLRVKVFTQNRAIICNDAEQIKAWKTDYLLRSWVGVPLQVDDNVLGVLAAGTTETNMYQQENVDLLQLFANQAAVAIRNAHLFAQVSTARDVAEAAKQTAEAAKQAAEAANQAKSTFLANVSHDLRTPLNGIMGYTQILLRDQHLAPRQVSALKTISESGELLLTMINGLLDLAKIEAGRIELMPAYFNFHSFLTALQRIIEPAAHQKGLQFEVVSHTKLPDRIYTDETRLQQVLQNLLGNAIKFTATGSVTLSVTAQPTKLKADDEFYWEFKFVVEDTGIGIDPTEQGEIFSPFYQVDTARFGASGTGLGLPIAQRLIEMIGGQLQLESRLGEGSRFSFVIELPAISMDDSASQMTELRPIGYQSQQADVVRFMVLIIDDNQTNRATLREMLHLLNFIVIEADNGETAINLADENEPHLILVDLLMPGLDGFATTRALRRLPHLADRPIIAVSASVSDEIKLKAKQAGCNDFIEKPVLIPDLLDKLSHWLALDWFYQTPSTQPNPFPLVFPAEDALLKLLTLTELGDIMTLETALQTLLKRDANLQTFVSYALNLTESFELDELQALFTPHTDTD